MCVRERERERERERDSDKEREDDINGDRQTNELREGRREGSETDREKQKSFLTIHC